MSDFTDALERIKGLECPADMVEKRVQAVLASYLGGYCKDISISRSERLDRGELKAYSAYVGGENDKCVLIYVKEGLDHYVAKVVDIITV